MSKNSVHSNIPQNKQFSSQTYGDVNYNVVTSDNTPEMLGYSGFLGKGHGGGGESGRINGDVMHTDTYAKFIDICSEGPIVGPVNGLNSVFLNGTPILDKNGSLNFKGVQAYPLYGTEDQLFPPMFQKSGNTITVDAKIVKDTPYVLTISDENITSVNLIIKVPFLASYDNAGNVNGTTVNFDIFVEGKLFASKNISGIATGTIEKAFVVNLRDYAAPRTVTIRRNTADSVDPKLQNDTYLASYTPMIDYTINYAGRAGLAFCLEAAQFGVQLPDRSALVRGIKSIKIPVNYDPVTREYSGVWNGVFKQDYTNNPVWCFYDILTNTRYGAGDHIDPDLIDKFELYDIAKYCDDIVEGSGDVRFTFNAIINSREQALALIKKFQSNFLAVLFYFGGVIKLSQDAPGSVKALVTNSNVIDGVFNYSSIEADKQTNTVVVSFNDPNNNYKISTETVYNNALLDKNKAEVKKELYAFGCTSRKQAFRVGKYQLLSDVMCSETVSYVSGMDHAKVLLGDIVEVHDNFLSTSVSSGRIIAMKGVSVTIDRQVTFISGVIYTLDILDVSGGFTKLDVDPATVGNLSTFNVLDAKGMQASPFAIFGIKDNASLQARLYKIIDIKEKDKNKYEITANLYDEEKFDILYSSAPPDIEPSHKLPEVVTPVNLHLTSHTLKRDGINVINSSNFAWNRVKGASHYEFQYRINSSEFTQIERQDDNKLNLLGDSGIYDIRVRAIDVLNRSSNFVENKFNISIGSIVPADVTSFSIHRSGNILFFNWDAPTPEERAILKYFEIRLGDSWASALTVFSTLNNSYSYAMNTAGTFFIKAVNIAGTESVNSATANAFPTDSNIFVTDDYKTLGYPLGTLTNLLYEPSEQRLSLVPFGYPDAWEDVTAQWDTLTERWDGDIFKGLIGVYETPIKDLGGIEDVFIHTTAEKEDGDVDLGLDVLSAVSIQDMDASWVKTGSSDVSKLSSMIRYSQNGVDYTNYTPLVSGQYKGRYFQYKLTIEALVPVSHIYVNDYVVQYDIPDLLEKGVITTDGNGVFTYVYTKTYHTASLVVLGNPTDPTLNVTVKTKTKSITQAVFETVNQATGLAAPNIQVNVIIKGY